MKQLEYFYDYADKNSIDVINHRFEDLKGFFYTKNNKNYIFMDYRNITSTSEEKCVLAEECTHYAVGVTTINIFSNEYSNKIISSKNEFKALKWSSSKLNPFQYLKSF